MAELSESTLKVWKPDRFYCSFWPMLDGRYLTFFWQILYNLLSCFCQLAILVFPFFFFFNSTLINICVLHSIFKEFIEFVRIDTVRYYWPVRWESCWALATSQRVRQSLGLFKFTSWIFHHSDLIRFSQTHCVRALFTPLPKLEILVLTWTSRLLSSTSKK